MNIKVCEIKSVEQLFQLDKLEIEYVGLVFDKSSIHYIRNFIQAADITSAEIEILKVGVFVNSPVEEIFKTIEEFDLDLIQLNGNESPQFCKLISNKIEVIKTFQLEDFNKTAIEIKIKAKLDNIFIKIPILIRSVMPALSNNYISLFKDTSVAAIVAVPELTFQTRKINTDTFRTIEAWSSASVLYVVACLLIAILLRRVERRVAIPK